MTSGDVDGMVDPTMGDYTTSAMWRIAELAMLCAEPSGMYRPTMANIIHVISGVIESETNGAMPMMLCPPYGEKEDEEGEDGYYEGQEMETVDLTNIHVDKM